MGCSPSTLIANSLPHGLSRVKLSESYQPPFEVGDLEVLVISKRKTSQPLGLILCVEGEEFFSTVKELEDCGAIPEWNAQHPVQQLKVGDLIISVNGRGGKGSSGHADIIEQLRQSIRMHVIVRRAEKAPKTEIGGNDGDPTMDIQQHDIHEEFAEIDDENWVSQLPSAHIIYPDGEACSFCKVKLFSLDSAVQLPCGHIFDMKCARQILQPSRSLSGGCPSCRGLTAMRSPHAITASRRPPLHCCAEETTVPETVWSNTAYDDFTVNEFTLNEHLLDGGVDQLKLHNRNLHLLSVLESDYPYTEIGGKRPDDQSTGILNENVDKENTLGDTGLIVPSSSVLFAEATTDTTTTPKNCSLCSLARSSSGLDAAAHRVDEKHKADRSTKFPDSGRGNVDENRLIAQIKPNASNSDAPCVEPTVESVAEIRDWKQCLLPKSGLRLDSTGNGVGEMQANHHLTETPHLRLNFSNNNRLYAKQQQDMHSSSVVFAEPTVNSISTQHCKQCLLPTSSLGVEGPTNGIHAGKMCHQMTVTHGLAFNMVGQDHMRENEKHILSHSDCVYTEETYDSVAGLVEPPRVLRIAKQHRA